MKSLLTLAAARPLVALGLGYVPFLLLGAALVGLQSGWRTAGVVLGVNSALVLVPLACIGLAGRLLLRPADARPWWRLRLGAIAGGLVLLGAVAFVGVALLEAPSLQPIVHDVRVVPPPPRWQQWLGVAALVPGIQLVPLAVGLGVEAVARRISLGRPAP